MLRKLLLLFFAGITVSAQAQTAVTWTAPITITGITGFDCPRICISNSTPVVGYGDFLTGNFFVTRFTGGNFTSPIQINPTGLSALISSNGGPEMKASGDTIYTTYIDINATHVYLQRSFDGGLIFGDTIKVDNINNNIPQYPTVAILPDGNPIIAFALLTPSFTNPQYVVTKSMDAGTTFLPEVNATASLSSDPCDCCQGSIVVSNNKVAVIYRNSINDLRDMRAAISTDQATSFSSIGEIDNNGWIEQNCPSSGGRGIIQGDTLISVFMNGINGNACYISTFNLITGQPGFEKRLFDVPGIGNQDVSGIAGNGDTLGVVWDQEINGLRNILFSYSTTGASGIGINVDTISDIIANGFHTLPDLAYANGKFYLVFNDYVAAQVYYMEGTVNSVSGLQNQLPSDNVSISIIDNTTISIQSEKIIPAPVLVSIYTETGQLMEKIQLNSLHSTQLLKLKLKLSAGVYIVRISTTKNLVSSKLLIKQG